MFKKTKNVKNLGKKKKLYTYLKKKKKNTLLSYHIAFWSTGALLGQALPSPSAFSLTLPPTHP